MSRTLLEVVVALVPRDGRWLVAKRRANAHLGGLWEFPGGKCEPGEDPPTTAIRELSEECGVQAEAEDVWTPLTWDYGDRLVRITPVLCRWVSGEGRALASEACRWVTMDELGRLEMPAVNAEILRAIRAIR